MAPCHSFRRRSCGGRIVRRPSRTSSQLNINHHHISPSSHLIEAQRPSKKIVRRNSIRRSFNKQFFFSSFSFRLHVLYIIYIYTFSLCIEWTLSYIQSSVRIKKKTSIKKYPQNIHQKTIGPPPVLNSRRRRRTKIHSGILPHTHTHTHTLLLREWRWAYKSSDQKLYNDPKHESLHTRFQSGKESIIKKTGTRNKKRTRNPHKKIY
jgi:hypothetical protein